MLPGPTISLNSPKIPVVAANCDTSIKRRTGNIPIWVDSLDFLVDDTVPLELALTI
jgi:hypothetical protein